MNDWISKNIWKIMLAIVVVAVILIAVELSIYILHFGAEITTDHGKWGTFGDFLGGTLNPILSFLGLIALLLTIILQSKELEETRKELELSRKAQENSEKALNEQAKTLSLQLEQSRKASSAEFFFKAVLLIQEEEVRNARRKAFELTKDNAKPYGKWYDSEKNQVEKACQAYDVIGKLIRYDFVEEKMILNSWHTSIIKTWEATQNLVQERRRLDGKEFWSDFEWLYEQSKKYS